MLQTITNRGLISGGAEYFNPNTNNNKVDSTFNQHQYSNGHNVLAFTRRVKREMLIESPEAVLVLIASKLVPYKMITYFNETFGIYQLTFEKKASLSCTFILLHTHTNNKTQLIFDKLVNITEINFRYIPTPAPPPPIKKLD